MTIQSFKNENDISHAEQKIVDIRHKLNISKTAKQAKDDGDATAEALHETLNTMQEHRSELDAIRSELKAIRSELKAIRSELKALKG